MNDPSNTAREAAPPKNVSAASANAALNAREYPRNLVKTQP